MNTDILQLLRYGLQKRIRRLNTIRNDDQYLLTLRQFWHYLQGNGLLWGVIEDLQRRGLGCETCSS